VNLKPNVSGMLNKLRPIAKRRKKTRRKNARKRRNKSA